MPLPTPEHVHTVAIEFLRLTSWRERSTWRQSRTRHLERVEQSMRETLDKFCDGKVPLAALLAELESIDDWTARLRAECQAIAEARCKHASE